MIKQEEFDERRDTGARTSPERTELDRLGLAYEFGKRVRAAREARGWTVVGLARRASVMSAEVAAIESGTPMPASVAGRVASIAGVEFGSG